jgi:hypothetical protein
MRTEGKAICFFFTCHNGIVTEEKMEVLLIIEKGT